MKYNNSDRDFVVRPVVPAHDAERHTQPMTETNTSFLRESGTAPIGVYDSGVGGLTILSALRQELPQEDYIYIGDTAHIPYGNRSEAEVAELALHCCHFLLQQGVKLIVVACNTASQTALNVLRARYDHIPFVGVVPAVKPAARITRCGRIGVIATNQAARAAYLHQLIDNFAEGIEVEAIGCPELVTLAEEGQFDGPIVEETLRQALRPLLDKGVDVIVLGCTHFPAFRPAIERIVGKHVQVIDSGAAIARRVRSILDTGNATHPEQAAGEHLALWCSGDPVPFSQVASKLLGYQVSVKKAEIP